MKYFVKLAIVFTLFGEVAYSQKQSPKRNAPYKIEFAVKGWKDTVVYLANYYGESTFVRDTAKVDSQGRFVFEGESIDPGVYILVKNRTKVFDFAVGEDKTFSIKTDTTDFIGRLAVEGDEDNRVFFENIRNNAKMQKEAEPYLKVLKDSTLKDDQKKEAREGFNKISEKVYAYQKQLIKDHPKTLTARILKASIAIDMPEPRKLPNGKNDSVYQFNYYKEHFFDNFDLSDDAMIRLPTKEYQNKIYHYLDNVVYSHPDSIVAGVDRVVSLAKPNQETYKYAAWASLAHYQTSDFMGMDVVYPMLYDKYFDSGLMDFWIEEKTKKSLKEYADKLRLAQIGGMAHDLMMQDANLQPKRLYDIKAKYTVLMFFDHNCGHCRTETPKLVQEYNKSAAKLSYEVFAVDIDTTLAKMREFIKEFKTPWITVNGPRTYYKEPASRHYQYDTTPFCYIIENSTKKVLARRLPLDKTADFIEKHSKGFIKLPESSLARKSWGANPPKESPPPVPTPAPAATKTSAKPVPKKK